MIIPDLHTHPSPWRNAGGLYRVFIERAIEQNLGILGFSEHGPACHPHPKYRGLEAGEIGGYVQAVWDYKREYCDEIQIFCGLELDYLPEKLRFYQSLKEDYPFDYFLASVHLIDDWQVDDADSLSVSKYADKDLATLYWVYYERIIAACRTGLFQALAHVDYIRRSLPHPPRKPPEGAREVFAEVAAEIAASGVAVEINTRGMEIAGSPEFHPTRPFFQQLIRAGVRFTMGSDAHDPGRVGSGLRDARRMLRDGGVERLVYFKGFEMREVEI